MWSHLELLWVGVHGALDGPCQAQESQEGPAADSTRVKGGHQRSRQHLHCELQQLVTWVQCCRTHFQDAGASTEHLDSHSVTS